MSIAFPSLDFFNQLKDRMAASPPDGAESDAYCGVMVDDHLFVLEFDGQQCSAVAQGGNLLDLDFALAAPADAWREVLQGGQTLESLLDDDRLEVQGDADDGPELARAALPTIQAFFDGSEGLEVDFD